MKKKLEFTEVERDKSYIIFEDACNFGCVARLGKENGYNWHLTIPCAEIDLTGQYRNDLFEEAQILWDKHCETK